MLFRVKHSEDYCAMYDICGKRKDGKVLNCPFGSPAMKVFVRIVYCCLCFSSRLIELDFLLYYYYNCLVCIYVYMCFGLLSNICSVVGLVGWSLFRKQSRYQSILLLVLLVSRFFVFNLWMPYLPETYGYAYQPNELLSSKIQSLCPTITGNVCCTEYQFDTLRTQVQQVRFLLNSMIYILTHYLISNYCYFGWDWLLLLLSSNIWYCMW